MKRLQMHRHENHERWLVSYADFITLLFAFFVVMFASSQGNKASEVSASVRSALEEGKFSAAISTALGRGKHEANREPVIPDPKLTHEISRPATPLPAPAASPVSEGRSGEISRQAAESACRANCRAEK